MPKTRKTRKQKIHISAGHQAVSVELPERFTLTQSKNTFITTSLFPHRYLKPELTKITVLSVAIIVTEIIISALLNNHIILLPIISY